MKALRARVRCSVRREGDHTLITEYVVPLSDLGGNAVAALLSQDAINRVDVFETAPHMYGHHHVRAETTVTTWQVLPADLEVVT